MTGPSSLGWPVNQRHFKIQVKNIAVIMIFPIPLVAFRRRSLNKVCSCYFCMWALNYLSKITHRDFGGMMQNIKQTKCHAILVIGIASCTSSKTKVLLAKKWFGINIVLSSYSSFFSPLWPTRLSPLWLAKKNQQCVCSPLWLVDRFAIVTRPLFLSSGTLY